VAVILQNAACTPLTLDVSYWRVPVSGPPPADCGPQLRPYAELWHRDTLRNFIFLQRFSRAEGTGLAGSLPGPAKAENACDLLSAGHAAARSLIAVTPVIIVDYLSEFDDRL